MSTLDDADPYEALGGKPGGGNGHAGRNGNGSQEPPKPAPEVSSSADRQLGAGTGKTIYFHPRDADRIDEMVATLKRRNRRVQEGEDRIVGTLGSSLIVRIGCLMAAELAESDPEELFRLAARLSTNDVEAR